MRRCSDCKLEYSSASSGVRCPICEKLAAGKSGITYKRYKKKEK